MTDVLHDIVNACEFSNYYGDGVTGELYEMWHDYGVDHVYVWGDNYSDAEEAYIDYLDEKGACGAFTWVSVDDIKEAAKDKGLTWQASWPDWSDSVFEDLMEEVEADLRMVGHTTLDCDEYKAGGGSSPYMDYTWEGREITDADTIEDVARASAKECYSHEFLIGDEVWYEGDGVDINAGVFRVAGYADEDLEIEDENETWRVQNTTIEEYNRYNPAHRPPPGSWPPEEPTTKPKTEGDLTEDFFFPPLPKIKGGGLFGLPKSLMPRRRRRRR